MKERTVAKRYAKALFDLALESGDLGPVAADLTSLARASREVPSLVKGLADERIGIQRRLAAAARVASTLKVGKTVSNFLGLLISKGRAGLLDLIARDFAARFERHERLAACRASVALASQADEVKTRVEEIVGGALGAKARCDVDVDASLLGGFSVRIGDVRYDASIKGKLERMREELWKSA